MKHSRERRRNRGFTLVEVLLVLIILVVLASMAVVAYLPMQRRAYIDAAKTQVGLFSTPLEMYQMTIGEFPSSTQGLEALRFAPSDLPNPTKWNGPYLKSDVPKDP